MPFVKKECRDPEHKPCSVGDLCFKEYSELMKIWKENPRWTTVHDQFRHMFDCTDEQAARALAFFEFYIRHAHEYENKKVAENGDI